MLTQSTYLPVLPCLGHLGREARVALVANVCQAIRDDLRERGPDPHLMMLGAALDYCASLLRDAGEDVVGDGADAALAQLDLVLGALAGALAAARHRPGEALLREDAVALLRTLFPAGTLPESLVAARSLVRMGHTAELRRALDRIGLRTQLHHVEMALQDAELWISRCRDPSRFDDRRPRGRTVTRAADVLLRRVVGHVTAVTDTADTEQRVRAAFLLGPLLEASGHAAAGDVADVPQSAAGRRR